MEWAIAIRSDLLTPLFKAFTALGYGGFLFLFLPLGYWLLSKNIFARVGLWLLLSAILNAYLKDLFQDPRPNPVFLLDREVELSYGFPSGHAQMAIVVWFWIAWEVRKTWMWILSTTLVLGISFSRLYLGVHDLGDVLGGIVIGLVSLMIFIFVTTKRFWWWCRLHSLWQVLALLIIEAIFFLSWPGKTSLNVKWAGALLMGFWIGVIIERRWIFFQKPPGWVRMIASGVIGVILYIALQKGFYLVTAMFENGKTTVIFFQAFAMGVYVTALAPWIFQRIRLAKKD